MTEDQLAILCNTFKLGKSISPIRRVFGGLLHKMWRLDTEKNIFAIKQLSKSIELNESTRKHYELTEDISYRFASHDIPAVTSIKHNGLSLIDVKGETFIVYPWVFGKSLSFSEITTESAAKIGRLLAKLHSINLVISADINSTYHAHSNENIAKLVNYFLESNHPFATRLVNKAPLLLELNSNYQVALQALNSHLVISHGDLDPKNVLWDDSCQPILIDWESSRLVNPDYEIINAALDWSGVTTGSINEKVFATMISSYISAGGTIKCETLMNIFECIKGNWINWLYFNLNRSMNSVSLDERDIGVEQVMKTLDTIIYLQSKTHDLIKRISDL